VVLVRVPLVWNAKAHLDSDLAVDGLTLVDALNGQWRWHFPGTPHMGIAPLFAAYAQALVWGPSPEVLVSGGVVLYLLTILAIFALAWRVFGERVACWSLLPLSVASTGIVWLSGRITGGHLLAVGWCALLFLFLAEYTRRGGLVRSGLLGLACGLGVSFDGLLWPSAGIVLSLSALATLQRAFRIDRSPTTGGVWGRSCTLRIVIRIVFPLVLVGLTFLAGREVQAAGKRADPYDSYQGQFDLILVRQPRSEQFDWTAIKRLAEDHSRILVLDCLPRLFAGHRLPGLQWEPSRAALSGPVNRREPDRYDLLSAISTALGLMIAALGFGRLFKTPELLLSANHQEREAELSVRNAVTSGLIAVTLLHLLAFVMLRNIYNSDNYRYLAILIIPWSLGVGLAFASWNSRPGASRVVCVMTACTFAALMTLDTVRWYQSFGWLEGMRPQKSERVDSALRWLNEHPEVNAIQGSYWDVYRLSFLTGGRVRGLPYPNYPDRFDWAKDLPGYRPRVLLGRDYDDFGPFYRGRALSEGGKLLHYEAAFWVIDWP
jgi:hypothetical protein